VKAGLAPELSTVTAELGNARSLTVRPGGTRAEVRRSGGTSTPRPAACRSFSTKADTFIEGTGVFVSQDRAECEGGKVPLQWRIFPPGAAKIREGEMEHCEDLQSSEEFKTRAVRLALDEGKTVGAVARDLDLTASAAASGSNTRWPSGRRARAV
jgi:hypothetical protein